LDLSTHLWIRSRLGDKLYDCYSKRIEVTLESKGWNSIKGETRNIESSNGIE
jgi:hypothetical protein